MSRLIASIACLFLIATLSGVVVAERREIISAVPLPYQYTDSALHISSLVLDTSITITATADVTVPTATVWAVGSALPASIPQNYLVRQYPFGWADFLDFRVAPPPEISYNPDGSEYQPQAPNPSAASSLAIAPALQLLVVSLSSFFAYMTKSPKIAVSILLLALVCGVPLAAAPGDPSIEILLQVPLNFKFTDIHIRVKDGSLAATGPFTADNLRGVLCEGGASSAFTVTNVAVRSLLEGCSISTLSATNIRQATNRLSVNLESTQSTATLGFVGGYSGTFSLKSSSTKSATGICTTTSTTAQETAGNCGWGQWSDVTVTGATGASGAFGQLCGSDWLGDPEWVDQAPPSPALNPSRPSESEYFETLSELEFRNTYGSSGNLTAIPGGGMYAPPAWGMPGPPYTFWILTKTDVEFRAGFAYQASITLKADSRSGTKPQISSVTPGLIAFIWNSGNQWRLGPDFYTANATYVRGYTDAMLDTPIGATTTTVAVTITPATTGTARLVFRLELAAGPQSNPYFQINYTDITWTAMPTPWTDPALVDGHSEFVTIPKMSPALDVTTHDTADCPHLQSGLKYWHDPATWGGSVPTAGSTITLPSSTRVLVSSCSMTRGAPYNKIVVPATSELIFSDAPIDLQLKAMLVQGKLSIGAPKCRLNAPIKVTFVGAKSTNNDIAANMGTKGIGVEMGAVLDIHGKQFNPTWTRLAATVSPGDNRLYLQDSVNWWVGQVIVLTPTNYKDYDATPTQHETFTITAISADKKVLQIEPSASFTHYGGSEYQAEVGLLSRQIVFQGNEADSVTDQFGGHVMIMGEGRASGVQFYRMGQTNVLARYPWHWHLIQHCPQCSISDSSFLDSFYRCVSVHATHETLVTRNVAFNVIGHCYYLEEGVEENNTMSYNLAARVRSIGAAMVSCCQDGDIRVESPTLVLPADGAAAGFYITNAYNRIIGNAASGGWAGFSFPGLLTPLQTSKNLPMVPQERPTLEFDGNTVHSGGYHFAGDGGCIYVGGKLWYNGTNQILTYDSGRYSRDTVDAAGNPVWMRFTNTKAFMCQMGISHWGERLEVQYYEAHDIRRSVQLFGSSWLGNALINAKSGNPTNLGAVTTGFQTYDTWVRTLLTDVTYRNFQPTGDNDVYSNDNRCIITMTHSDQFKPQGINAVKALSFDSTPASQRVGHKLVETGSSRYYNYQDQDGSLVGTPGSWIIGSASPGEWWRVAPDCYLRSDWNMWVCPASSTRTVASLDVFSAPMLGDYGYAPDPQYYRGTMNLFGPGIPTGRNSTLTPNIIITGTTGVGWYMNLNGGAPKSLKIYPRMIPQGTYVIFAMHYPTGTTFAFNAKTSWNQPNNVGSAAASFNALLTGNGNQYYYNTNTGHVYFKLVNPLAGSDTFSRGGATLYSVECCYYYEITATCSGTGADANQCPDAGFSQPPDWV